MGKIFLSPCPFRIGFFTKSFQTFLEVKADIKLKFIHSEKATKIGQNLEVHLKLDRSLESSLYCLWPSQNI